MQPHTPAALGFTTGLEAQCGVAAHVQPGAQTPASAAAAYSTPLTKVRVADRMPGRADDTSGSDDDGDGSPSVRGQGPMRGRVRGRGRGGGRSRRECDETEPEQPLRAPLSCVGHSTTWN